MMLKVYSVRDNKTGDFNVPFFEQNDVQATRMFHKLCNDDRVQIAHFPDDFDMYCIGLFDDKSGKLESFAAPEFMVAATSFKKLVDKEEKERRK